MKGLEKTSKQSHTIIQAVHEVLVASRSPLTAQEIYQQIVDKRLYEFKAKDPLSVMRAAIRKNLRSQRLGKMSTLCVVDRDRFIITRPSGE
jgi:hypothetical protein